jgi:putative ABC transport system permease protein
MTLREIARIAFGAVRAYRLRSVLTALGIAVGVAAVVLLTSIGEGLQRFVVTEFTQFGTNIIAINPGRTTTFGVSPAIISSIRPLAIADAVALRRVRDVEAVVPVVQGNAQVDGGGRIRRTNIIGTGPEMPLVYQFPVSVGRFLPADAAEAPRPFVVLGSKVARELFGREGDGEPGGGGERDGSRGSDALGRKVRIGGERYRVVGVMSSKGQVLGFDLDDAVYIPVQRALEMFDREGLMEIDVVYSPGAPESEVVAGIDRILVSRHRQDDFTVTTQKQMLDVLGKILGVLTFAVGALGGISLLVGGVGILTIMTIAVTERTAEIGLLRALGAERRQVLALFLLEAVVLAALGGGFGLGAGAGGAWLLHAIFPALPVRTTWFFAGLAEATAVSIGLLAGILPASRAARLDPLEALRTE